jgi:hypothetical protein
MTLTIVRLFLNSAWTRTGSLKENLESFRAQFSWLWCRRAHRLHFRLCGEDVNRGEEYRWEQAQRGPCQSGGFYLKVLQPHAGLTTARPLLSSRGTHISLLCFFKHYHYSIHLLRSPDYFRSRFGLFILNWTHLIFFLRIWTFYFRVRSILRDLFILAFNNFVSEFRLFFQIGSVHFLFDLCMYF